MIRRKYSTDGGTCSVTFVFDRRPGPRPQRVSVVGDFNNWDPDADRMKRRKDGSFSISKRLSSGASYEFRYLVDGESWQNESTADAFAPTPFGDAENCIVRV